MSHSGIIQKGAVAVITGAASGIGLAAAQIFAKEGLSLFLVDVSDGLDAAVDQVRQVEGVGQVESMRVDVSKVDEVVKMRERVFEDFGEVHILMNNAGVGRPTPAFSLDTSLEDLQDNWNTVLGTNLFGVLNVAQAFAPHMVRQENASVIINTGSKQGITCPPGNAGYNVSKAAVKTYTEQLAHELRNAPYSTCSAHLFVPGWTHTGMTGGGKGSSKPHGAWTAEQTVEYMIDKVFDQGDFYVICPDNETSSALDKARMLWSLGDVVENRPALSRWHPAYKARFEDFIAQKQGLSARSRSRGRPMERSESGMALNSPKVVAGPTIIE